MIGLCIIATRKYKQFVEPLLQQMDKFFLPKEELTVFIFTDEEFVYTYHDFDFEIKQFKIEPYFWPYATLYRFKIFDAYSKETKDCSHIFYLDVDMGIVSKVGEEILGEGLTVVRHPGFYVNGGYGSENVVPESKAYVPPEGRGKYFAGGFQGGRSDVFLKMSKELAENITDDENRGIIAEHNDESHMNHYIYSHPEIPRIELDPGYCMVEAVERRKEWGIDNFDVKIVALDKNHEEIRS